MDFMTDLKADHNENIARYVPSFVLFIYLIIHSLSHCLKRHEHTFHHPYLRPARLRRSTKPPLTPTLDASQRLKQLSIGSTMQVLVCVRDDLRFLYFWLWLPVSAIVISRQVLMTYLKMSECVLL